MKSSIKNLFVKRETFLFLAILILYLFLGVNSDTFFTIQNFRVMLLSISVNSIIASAMVILFISGGFDLSVGSVMATIGIVLGVLLNKGFNFIIAIILSVVLGVLIGTIMGIIITRFKINPFIVTLGGFFIFRGLAFILGNTFNERGAVVPQFSNFPESFNKISSQTLYGIEYIVFYMIVIVIVLYFLLLKNTFFRKNYYIGGNEKAAKLVGIKVNSIRIFNYALVSGMVAVATVLRVSRLGTASASTGETLGLEIIAAVIIGGASLRGGDGSVLGAVLGIVLITTIYNATITLGINPFYYKLILGIILLMSVLINDYIISKSKELVAR